MSGGVNGVGRNLLNNVIGGAAQGLANSFSLGGGGGGGGEVNEYRSKGSFINTGAQRDATLRQANERVLDSEANMVASNMTTDAQEKEMNTEHTNRQRLTSTSRQHQAQSVVADKMAQNAAKQLS